MISLKELYFEILERLPYNVREFLLKRGKDILILTLVIAVFYVLTLSFLKYQEMNRTNAAKQLGFAISEMDINKKENMFRMIISKYPNTPSANFSRLLLASLMFDLGKNDEAKALFQEAQKRYSKDEVFRYSARLGEAYTLLATQKQESISIFKEIIDDGNNPYTGVALISLAIILENEKDFKGAKIYYEKYLSLFPNNPDSQMIKEKIKNLELEGGNNTTSNV